MKFWTKRAGNGLFVYDSDSAAEFEKIPWRTPLRTEVTQPRNLGFHKLFFALCSRIASGIGKDTEFVVRSFKIETGKYTIYKTIGGREVIQLESIGFQHMDQISFKTFFEECVSVAYTIWQIDPASVADLLTKKEWEDQGR